jgi:hypothetical protein
MFGADHFDDGSAVLLEVLCQVFHELRGEFVSKLQTLQQSVAEIPAPSALATGPAPLFVVKRHVFSSRPTGRLALP